KVSNLADKLGKTFYLVILNAICRIPDSWDYFEITIDDSSKNRKFDNFIKEYNEYLLNNSILYPFSVSICFDEVYFKPENIHQLETTLAPFFTHIKRLRFVGMHISP